MQKGCVCQLPAHQQQLNQLPAAQPAHRHTGSTETQAARRTFTQTGMTFPINCCHINFCYVHMSYILKSLTQRHMDTIVKLPMLLEHAGGFIIHSNQLEALHLKQLLNRFSISAFKAIVWLE